jgi:hypothetical protein
VSLGAGLCVCVCVCQSAGKSALDRTGRCLSSVVCSENDTGQNGEWKSVCLTTLTVKGLWYIAHSILLHGRISSEY